MRIKLFVFMCLLPFMGVAQSTVSTIDLKNHPEKWVGKKITIEGKVLHVCPVKGQKMKLLADDDVIIKVLPGKACTQFEHSLNNCKVKVEGIINEERITRAQIDAMENPYGLCHIDHTTCLDSAWANNRLRKATTTRSEATKNFSEIMEKSGKEYIFVLTLTAVRVEKTENVPLKKGNE